MALQPFVGPWMLFQFMNLYTVGRTPKTVYEPVANPLPTHRYPCLEWDSNSRSRCLSGRREFMPYTARPLWSATIQVTKVYSRNKIYIGKNTGYISYCNIFRGALFGLRIGSRKPTEQSHLYSTCIAKANAELLPLSQLTDTRNFAAVKLISTRKSDELTVALKYQLTFRHSVSYRNTSITEETG
jgi:hypothetical protein